MDDTVMKSLKNMEYALKSIKGQEKLLRSLIDSNERVAESMDRLVHMMEESWHAYSQTLEQTEAAARHVRAKE